VRRWRRFTSQHLYYRKGTGRVQYAKERKSPAPGGDSLWKRQASGSHGHPWIKRNAKLRKNGNFSIEIRKKAEYNIKMYAKKREKHSTEVAGRKPLRHCRIEGEKKYAE
jgi:hypothetical protein